MPRRILVIDDVISEVDYRDLFEGCALDRLDWTSLALPRLRDPKNDLIVATMLGERSAPLEWLRRLRANPIPAPLLAILPQQADGELLRLMAETAADFVLWPAAREEIHQRVTRILGEVPSEIDEVSRRLTDEIGIKRLVGQDPAFLHLMTHIQILARRNRTVLITGETGTGKELGARAIHHLGPRRSFAFIPVDCGAFPDHLFENELFGHERGAFTDAHRRQKGLIAMAEGGTLFLDEIDSLSLSAQAKLLRFLEERTYRPLGGERFEHADVNVLAATNRDLDAMMREERFRPDLFFRLSVLRLHMLPLRERRDDIPILARHFLDALCAEEGIPRKSLAPSTVTDLVRMPWLGNVRELHNMIQRAFVFVDGPQVLPCHLAAARTGRAPEPIETSDRGGFRAARARAIEAFERDYVSETLRAHNGNITQAARSAHQDRRAFGRLVKRHKIEH